MERLNLDPQSQQLRALYEAGLVLAGDLTLDSVLQRVVDLARELAGATYAALGIFRSDGRIQAFITSGISAEERARMGPLPEGRGLLGEMLKTQQPFRVGSIADHPASVGFPRGHPKMTSLLGVPIVYQGRTLGILYLADKKGEPEFSEQDASLLELFAAQAAAAVENARLHMQTQEQAQQLRELYNAGLSLASDLSLDAVLQRVVDLARDLTSATYGALGVLGANKELEQFITSGLSHHERERIGPLPKGLGLLGTMMEGGEPLRLHNIAEHPASVGFPAGHPPMTSFLGVPVRHRGQLLGSLYLTDKRGADEFTEADTAIIVLFAGQAGLAIENARLHARVEQLAVEEERQRIAREMHDGLAQLLGYVNVKTGAVRRLIELGKNEDAAQELTQLEEAARGAYADVREGVLGLRVMTQEGGGFVPAIRAYIEQFRDQSGIDVDLDVQYDEQEFTWTPDAEVQLIRVVQEALSNVRKHSGALTASVRLATVGDELTLSIADSGAGFGAGRPTPGQGPRFGLQVMRERAESLGGSLEVQTEPGKGTTVLVRVPRRRRSA